MHRSLGRLSGLVGLAFAGASCAGTPLAVEGFYDRRVPEKIELQQWEGSETELSDTELSRAGLQVGLSDPDGFYRLWLQFYGEQVDAQMPEGPADFSGLGAGFGVSGRRIQGVVEKDSTLLIPYHIELNATEASGSSRPRADLEYDRFFYREAYFHLGLGAEWKPLIVTAGWAVQFTDGRVDAIETVSGEEFFRRNTLNGLNHGPFVTIGFVLADEQQPIRVELRLGGGDLEEIRLGIGVGY